jgi:hypothetical protein
MAVIILSLAIATAVSLGFLAVFVLLLIGMRAESRQLSPSTAPHTRTGSAVRRILGVYVRRELSNISLQHEHVRR